MENKALEIAGYALCGASGSIFAAAYFIFPPLALSGAGMLIAGFALIAASNKKESA